MKLYFHLIEYSFFSNMPVHGGLARSGKVKCLTPKVEKKEKPKPLTGRAKMRKKYNKHKNRKPGQQSNPAPHPGVVSISMNYWREHEITNYEKGIIMGNGPLPLSLRPSTVQKFKRNFHYSGGKHQDTMRAPARAVRRDQIEKKNSRCWNDSTDYLSIEDNLLELKILQEIKRTAPIILKPGLQNLICLFFRV